MRQGRRKLDVHEYLDPAGLHGPHEVYGIRIHAFVPVQKSDGNREKCGDDDQGDLWRHSESQPEDEQRRDRDGRDRLRYDEQRHEGLFKKREPVH